MDRHGRREYFGRTDTTSVITIEAMVARATRLMDRPLPPLLMVSDPNPTS